MPQRVIVRILILSAVIAVPLLIYVLPAVAAFIYEFIFFFAPLWLPAGLILLGWPLWLTFIRSHYVFSIPYSTIELKPGSETTRSARAMELVFYSLHHRTDISRTDAYLRGKIRMPWSFEIAAHNGAVRFFVHLPTSHRDAIESRIRGEYPDIDIDEVHDYAREVAYNPFTTHLIAREYTLKKPDPYPIKTYPSYEADKNKPEALAVLLEDLATTGEHEHVLLSLIIRPHQRERVGIFDAPRDTLHDAAHKEIVKLVGKKGDARALPTETQEVITAIENALKKPSFDCGLRVLYVADNEHFSASAEQKISNLFAPFEEGGLNAFVAYDPKEKIKWPLSEFFAIAPAFAAGYLLQLYRRRAFFTPPYFGTPFILNTEELATLFHIPHFARGSLLANMRGIRLEAPENLPI